MAKVFVFVPAFGRQITTTTFETTHALMSTLLAKGIPAAIASASYPDIEELRNMVLSWWYDTQADSTHLLFVDADMGFPPQAVLDMLAFGEPVVGGIYPKKAYPLEWVGSGLGQGEYRQGFIEVEGLGAGCLLIRRDAVTALIAKFPELVRPYVMIEDLKAAGATRTFGFFDCLRTPEGKVSEDISFCRRFRATGGRVWGSTAYRFTHEGPHAFVGGFAEQREAEHAHAQKMREVAESKVVKMTPCNRVQAKHGEFIYNPNDTFIGRSLQAYGEWCEFELDLLSNFIGAGDCVIDVGANIGTHAIAFARMVGADGHVLAIEPQPRLAGMLRFNIGLNDLGDIISVEQAAASVEAGVMPMASLPPDEVEFNFGALPLNAHVNPTESVRAMTIDQLALFPALIKIDVEGMEEDVIRGARMTIQRWALVLYLECNGEDTSAIADVLDEIHYRAYWSIGPYFNPRNHFGNKQNLWPNVMPSCNLIALPIHVPGNDTLAKLARFRRGDNWKAVCPQAAE